MKTTTLLLAALLNSWMASIAAPVVDNDDFAKSLGGWKKQDTYVDFPLSGAEYRTYKPEVSPTPDGGIFVSIRIDHLRGWLASNDHATLELTINSKGVISTAQSTVAIQGQSITSDVIVGTSVAGTDILKPERAVQIGADLISNLTAKLLQQNIVEAGRVSFPAVIRHNYNYLFQSIRLEGVAVQTAVAVPGVPIIEPPPIPVVTLPLPVPTPVVPAITSTPPVQIPVPETVPSPVAPAPIQTPVVPTAPTAPTVPTAPETPATPAPPAPPATTPAVAAPLEIKPY